MNTPAEREPLRPGPVAWLFIALGFGVMGTALLGVFREADQADPGNWIPWLVGAAIIHDAIVLPLVLLVGGGAGFFEEAIKDAFPQLKVSTPEAPVFANVRGFWRMGA